MNLWWHKFIPRKSEVHGEKQAMHIMPLKIGTHNGDPPTPNHLTQSSVTYFEHHADNLRSSFCSFYHWVDHGCRYRDQVAWGQDCFSWWRISRCARRRQWAIFWVVARPFMGQWWKLHEDRGWVWAVIDKTEIDKKRDWFSERHVAWKSLGDHVYIRMAKLSCEDLGRIQLLLSQVTQTIFSCQFVLLHRYLSCVVRDLLILTILSRMWDGGL